jgi:hypothetical protein
MKMMPTKFFYVFLGCASLAFAQNKKNVSGEFQMKVETSQTMEMAKQKVCDFARVQAMEEVFGRVVFQGNSTLIENVENGQKTQTNSVFTMLADTYVNADWLEDTQHPVLTQYLQNNELWLTCKVRGIAQEIAHTDLKISVETRDCPEKRCKTASFNHGERLYLHLKSPKDGFIAIFIDDRLSTACIYPYQKMPFEAFTNFKFEAQKEYQFFNKTMNLKENWNFTDEILTVTDQQQELNRIFILFSEHVIPIPVLNSASKHPDGTFIPRHLPSEEFQHWLQKMRSKDKTLHLEIRDIVIHKD